MPATRIGEGLDLFSSPHQTLEALASVGYITDEITATVVYLAARLNKPILKEGPPGSGKTQLAYAVAEATGAQIERLQCYEGINEEKAIGKFDEPLQRLAVELRSKSGSIEWEALQQELHSENSSVLARCCARFATTDDAYYWSTNWTRLTRHSRPKRLKGLPLVSDSAATCTTSLVPGWTWTNASDRRACQC